jgi:hypothetical protein
MLKVCKIQGFHGFLTNTNKSNNLKNLEILRMPGCYFRDIKNPCSVRILNGFPLGLERSLSPTPPESRREKERRER